MYLFNQNLHASADILPSEWQRYQITPDNTMSLNIDLDMRQTSRKAAEEEEIEKRISEELERRTKILVA